MGREIKFRAKRIDNGSWVYGQYFKTPLTDENSGTTSDTGWFFLTGEPRHCIVQDNVSFVIDVKTLGEFTGLKDKNGREIYEGDIAEVTYMGFIRFRVQIVFGEYEQDGSGGEYSPEKCIGFYAKAINKEITDEYGCKIIDECLETTSILSFDSIEVIGNIFEDGDFLGKS